MTERDTNTILVLRDGATHRDLAAATGTPRARIAAAGQLPGAEPDDQADVLWFPLLGLAVGRGGRDFTPGGCVSEALPERRYQLAGPPEGPEPTPPFEDGPDRAWGIAAVGADQSRYTGRGAKVAVLDTGFDVGHPDFAGREVIAQSFVPGEGPEDQHGHGTHCSGTACGGKDRRGRRYGVASDATLFVGKVFPAGGFATDTTILAGIEWALTRKCHVVSMSFETPVRPGQGCRSVYDTVGRRALDLGCVLVAAAGNQSRRPEFVAPVSSPADSPSIIAVAALDPSLHVAPFSNGAVNLDGGKVDIAAPGVNVYSSLPGGSHGYMTGTSQATPHVAGLLALWHEATGATGRDLWNHLAAAVMARGRRGANRVDDVGFGTALAP
ncbi:MAG: S8 family serine peptidase [Alphaproteobacteria bacterium]